MSLKNKKAFTLAEMMVVLLVMSLIMAAFLPVMTKRTKAGGSGGGGTDLWTYEGGTGPANIYWSEGDTLGAIIGADKSNSAMLARLFINKPSTMANDILFQETTAGVSADTGTLTVDGKGNVGLGGTTTFDSTKTDQVAIGNSAQTASIGGISIGKSSTASGTNAISIGKSSTASGAHSIAIGSTAWYAMDTSLTKATNNDSIAIGGRNEASGADSIAIGTQVKARGNTDIGIGLNALNSKTSTGTGNIAIGNTTLGSLSTGSNNTAIGGNACTNLTTSSNNTCIGYGASVYSPAASNQIGIGSASTTRTDIYGDVYIHGNAYIQGFAITKMFNSHLPTSNYDYYVVQTNSTADNAVTLMGEQYAFSGLGGSTPNFSDRRLKNIKGPSVAGLEQIKKLKTYNYTFKKDKEKIPHVGVIAQDLQKIFPDAVTKSKDGYLMIRQDDMFYAMMNSIKQLDTILQGLVKDFKSLVTRVQTIDDKILALIKADQLNVKKIKELQLKNSLLENQNRAFEARLNKLEKKVR